MNNAAVIGGVIVLLVIVVAAAYLFTSGKSPAPSSSVTTTAAATYPTTTVQGGSTVTPPATTTMMAPTSYTVMLESSSTLGSYLANATGYALYTFKGDVAYTNVSSCTSTCARDWPPFYAADLSVAPGLNASAFGTITRVGGAKQLTYKGWPLYLFTGDSKAGQVNGNGVGNFQLATK